MKKAEQFTPAALSRGIKKYFSCISQYVAVTETVESGEYTKGGKAVVAQRVVTDKNGKPFRRLQYYVPPTLTGLCNYLKIARETLDLLENNEEFCEIILDAKNKIREYLEIEALGRGGAAALLEALGNPYDDKIAVQKLSLDERMRVLEQIASENISLTGKLYDDR